MNNLILIIGAGPAGLTAAYELLRSNNDHKRIVVLEKEAEVGGLSKTVGTESFRVDLGGHRYFSKNREIINWWNAILGEDLLELERSSKILFRKKLIDYPIALNQETIRAIGFYDGVKVLLSYTESTLKGQKSESLKDFFERRFGKKLYELFFESYTKKVWGRDAADISADWGQQRIQGFSLTDIFMGFLCRKKQKNKIRTLTPSFLYPRNGSGSLWDRVAQKIEEMGGEIICNETVESIKLLDNHIQEVTCISGNHYTPAYLVSSMPLSDLILSLSDAPKQYMTIAEQLEYRDFILVALLVDRNSIKELLLDDTGTRVINDQWIYVQDSTFKHGRIQLFDNWSPELQKNKRYFCFGVEFFCSKIDSLWKKQDSELTNIALSELKQIGMIRQATELESSAVFRVEKAYPCYWGAYSDVSRIREYISMKLITCFA